MLKYLKQKKHFSALTVVLVAALFFLLVKPVRAGLIADVSLIGYGTIVYVCVSVLGQLLLVVIDVMVSIAQYNNFINVDPVKMGWLIVRDICNMFFVLILLIIAFATILHIPGYSIKQLFKRVIIFAILINFSKMICGLLIDFSQVIMLTFVNAFKDIGGGNMSMLLGVDQLLSIRSSDLQNREDVTYWSTMGALSLAWLYVVIMLVVMVALLATLVYRVVMLWIYIILSPLAYLASIVPFMSGLSKNWWQQFSHQLFTGPLLAFFIWLSLATLGQFKDNQTFVTDMGFDTPKGQEQLTAPSIGITEVGTKNHVLRFVISIGLLIGGLVVSKSFGGSAAGAISQVVGRAQSGAGWLKRKSFGLAKRGAAATGRATWSGAKLAGRGGISLAKGVDYAASKRLAESRAQRAGIEGFEYQYKQGAATRAAASVRDAFKSLNVKKQIENKGFLNTQRVAAKASGYHVDEAGRRFDVIKEGEHKGKYGFKDANGNYDFWRDKNGKVVTEMGDFSHKFHESWRATGAGVAKSSARTEAAKKEMEELEKPFKDRSKEELWALSEGTTSPERLQGIYKALAGKKGGLRDTDMQRAIGAFSMHPERLKTFMDAAVKTNPENVYNPDSELDKKAMAIKIKKGDIKLDEVEFNGYKLKDGEMTAADKEMMSKFLKIFREALGHERYQAQTSKVNKEGSAEFSQKLSLASGLAGQQAHLDYLRTGDLKKQNEAFSFYKDQLKLDSDGDITKFGQLPDGRVDTVMLKKLFSEGSVKDLGEINATSISRSPAAVAAIMNMPFEKLRGLQKSNSNPELVRVIAQTMAKYNHVEADKIPYNIANDIDVNLEAVNQNKAIRDLAKEEKPAGFDVNDYRKINDFRENLDRANKAFVESGQAGPIPKYYDNGKATEVLRAEFKKAFG